jgi:GTP-binding protein
MQRQTEIAVEMADLLLLTIDAHIGVTGEDHEWAKWARKKGKPIILVANKCERKDLDLEGTYSLGFGQPIAVSAEHGLGMDELAHALKKHLKATPLEAEVEEEKALQFTLLGRPNVGKSTIVNKLLHTERVIASPIAGTTRDSIAVDWEYKNQKLKLIDTAGLRKRSNIIESLEQMSASDSIASIQYAHVILLVLDATEALERQDLKLAELVISEGRALVVVINKWDLIKEKKEYLEELDYRLAKYLNDVPNVPVVKISAANDSDITILLDEALRIYEVWNKRISTGQLNRWLEGILENTPPPIVSGKRIKIRYITQIKARPPTFMLSTSLPKSMPDSYVKFLTNDLRKNFDLPGVPIRMNMRKKDNPYEKKKK